MMDCKRCPVSVVQMANSLIAHNANREDKEMNPMNENGDGDVRVIQYPSVEDEISGVAEIVRSLVFDDEVRPGDILVLVQRKRLGVPLFERIVASGVPAKSYYSESELDSEQAQERMAELRLYVDFNDRSALRWYLGYGSDNFRAPAYARIRQHCRESGLEPWVVLEGLEAGDIRIPYTNPLVNRFTQLQGVIAGFEEYEDIHEFIDIWLDEQVDELEEVRVMSLHGSKGLSSPVVIIFGCIEGLHPPAPEDGLTPWNRPNS